MGRLVYEKKIGKNGAIKVFYFRDGYREYAYRRAKDGKWYESAATSYSQQSLDKAIKEAREYKTMRDIESLHPALRNYGYDYKGMNLKGFYR